MGVSTNGQLCYGIIFEEGFEFPWDKGNYEGDMDEWWMEVSGFKPTMDIWDDDDTKKEGVTEEDKKRYYAERWKWCKDNPVPVERVNYCSGDCDMYILAIPSTIKTANRGYPEELTENALQIAGNAATKLVEFCEKYDIEIEEQPKWWLSSYWG